MISAVEGRRVLSVEELEEEAEETEEMEEMEEMEDDLGVGLAAMASEVWHFL
jgi:hypothetical protein